MSLVSFVERLFVGKRGMAERERVRVAISEERENLKNQQLLLRGDVRQYAQLVDSSARIMNTMTNAMIMVEASRGRSSK